MLVTISARNGIGPGRAYPATALSIGPRADELCCQM